MPTTSGETLIDFMVNGESILGSPCLGQCWLVGGCVGFVGLLNNVDYRELEFVFVVWMDLLFLFWSLLFFVLCFLEI